MTKKLETIAARLRTARALKGISQAECAQAINKTTTAYGHYERDRNEMSIDEANKLSALLEVNFEWLAIGSGPMKKSEFLETMAKIDDSALILELKDLALKRMLEREK